MRVVLAVVNLYNVFWNQDENLTLEPSRLWGTSKLPKPRFSLVSARRRRHMKSQQKINCYRVLILVLCQNNMPTRAIMDPTSGSHLRPRKCALTRPISNKRNQNLTQCPLPCKRWFCISRTFFVQAMEVQYHKFPSSILENGTKFPIETLLFTHRSWNQNFRILNSTRFYQKF